MATTTSNAKLAGLSRFTDAQKADSLRRLREAARRLFGESGYLAVSIDDIAQEAGVTRKTFYRHFAGKPDVAIDLFDGQLAGAESLWAEIGRGDYRDPAAVRAWLERLIDHHAQGVMSRTIIELGLSDPEMKARLAQIPQRLLAALGDIPAFAIPADDPAQGRRRARAMMLVYQLMDQCAAFVGGVLDIDRALLVDILAESFVAFVAEAESERPRGDARRERA